MPSLALAFGIASAGAGSDYPAAAANNAKNFAPETLSDPNVKQKREVEEEEEKKTK